jgi:hypothetical protein
VAGKEGNPNASHYSASKAGLIALTKSLAKETATKGVLVNAIAPAAAKTAIFDQMQQTHIDYMLSKIPMGRFVEVAADAPQQQVLHQGLLHVHAVLGLVPDHRLRAVDDLGGDLLAAVRRQAVHEQRIGLATAIISSSTHQSAKALRRSSFSAS